jgi:Arc/MetJ-type ribon-helix-helix transcriptional regulator
MRQKGKLEPKKERRLLVQLDEKLDEIVTELTEKGRYRSQAEAIRQAVLLVHSLQKQAEQGYTEILVRQPGGKSKEVIGQKLL